MAEDKNNSNATPYVGGFSLGGFQGGSAAMPAAGQAQPTQPVPAAPTPVPVPPIPPAPVYPQTAPITPTQTVQQPVYSEPYGQPPPLQSYDSQPVPPPPPPMAGMGDPHAGTTPAAQQPPFDPNYRFGDRMKNFTTTIKLPAHSLQFDEDRFLNLLAGSISLSREEKKRIIDSIPKLRQEQVDELMRIFDEERVKFIELSPKHGAQLKKLEDEHAADWHDLEMAYKAESKGQEDQSKADEIRKQLGL